MRLLTWNIDMAPVSLEQRMEAIARRVEALDPDVIALQEVTEKSQALLEQSPWFYGAQSIPRGPEDMHYYTMLYARDGFATGERLAFKNSNMERDLVVGQAHGSSLAVASSHLESLSKHADIRAVQFEAAMSRLSAASCAVFMGDMNLIAGVDEEPVLPSGWVDGWLACDKPESDGYTFDCERNALARKYRTRLDRAYCRLGEVYRLATVELVGTAQIAPGLYCSDHFGLVVELQESRDS